MASTRKRRTPDKSTVSGKRRGRNGRSSSSSSASSSSATAAAATATTGASSRLVTLASKHQVDDIDRVLDAQCRRVLADFDGTAEQRKVVTLALSQMRESIIDKINRYTVAPSKDPTQDMEPLDASLLENIEQLEANLVELGPKLKKVRRQTQADLAKAIQAKLAAVPTEDTDGDAGAAAAVAIESGVQQVPSKDFDRLTADYTKIATDLRGLVDLLSRQGADSKEIVKVASKLWPEEH